MSNSEHPEFTYDPNARDVFDLREAKSIKIVCRIIDEPINQGDTMTDKPTRVGDVVTDIDSLAFLTVVRDDNHEVFERWSGDTWARVGYSLKEKTVPRAPVTVIYVLTEEDSK